MWYFSCPFAKDIDKHVSPWTLQLSFVYRNVCNQWAFYLWPAVSYGFGLSLYVFLSLSLSVFCLLICLLSHLQVLRQDIIVPEPACIDALLQSPECVLNQMSNVMNASLDSKVNKPKKNERGKLFQLEKVFRMRKSMLQRPSSKKEKQ